MSHPGVDRLVDLMARLRRTGDGCDWCLKQTFKSFAPSLIEEAYEVVEAVENMDNASLKEELGDLLMLVAFMARLGEEQGAFAIDDLAHAVTDKLIERHPHVFGDGKGNDADAILANWEVNKAKKKAEAAEAAQTEKPRTLDGIAATLPAMARAYKLQERAATVGFDWDKIGDVVGKIHEELAELEHEIETAPKRDPKIEAELGDLLFAVINLARHVKVDPETALRTTNRKFERRFRAVEDKLVAQGKTPQTSSLTEMDALWEEVKMAEKGEG